MLLFIHDEGVDALSWVIFVFLARKGVDGTEEHRKWRVGSKVVGADKGSLDVGGFVFVFYVVSICSV